MKITILGKEIEILDPEDIKILKELYTSSFTGCLYFAVDECDTLCAYDSEPLLEIAYGEWMATHFVSLLYNPVIFENDTDWIKSMIIIDTDEFFELLG